MRSKTKIAVTVVVPVKNEEKNLEGCLERLGRFERVIVVDSGSTDRTEEIARAHGAEFLIFEWNGRFPKKRNWVLMNHAITTPWVLFIDADEYATDAFCDAVETAIASDNYVGYWLNYTNHFLGEELKYGLPQRKLAMFRVGEALYERIDEAAWSTLDMEIHEHPIVRGTVGEIFAPIDHQDFLGLKKFLDRHIDYAQWEAKRVLLLECEPSKNGHLTSRQRFKYRHLKKWWYPWFYFIYVYFARLGILDGSAGFYYAFYKAWYFCSIRLLIQEARREQVGPR